MGSTSEGPPGSSLYLKGLTCHLSHFLGLMIMTDHVSLYTKSVAKAETGKNDGKKSQQAIGEDTRESSSGRAHAI